MVAVTNPNDRLLDHQVEDDLEFNEEQPTLCFRIFAKKRIAFFVSIFAFLALALASSFGGIFFTRYKAIVNFKGNLTRFLNEKFTLIGPEERASHVDELTELFRNGYITDDHVAEFEVLMEFTDFNEVYSRKHADAEERRIRFLTFRNNYNAVKAQTGEELYEKELNQFSDMTKEEFARLFPAISIEDIQLPTSSKGENIPFTPEQIEKLRIAKGLDADAEVSLDGEDVDWRRCGGVSPAKDQKDCGSCWAFATIGAVESIYLIKKGIALDLSEQELINCEDSSLGCRGGLCNKALSYIKTRGISHSKDVPYHATDEKCALPPSERIFINGFLSNDGMDILEKGLSRAPTTVYIAVSDELAHYKSGIYNGSCGDTLNHAVLLVGEGRDEATGKRYWILKNSWGPNWGEDGFFRLERTGEFLDKCTILRAGFTPDL